MEKGRRRLPRSGGLAVLFAVLFCLSLGVNAVQSADNRELRMHLSMERQRDMTDVVSAMADIEVNLQKLLIASGVRQNVTLLGETALLAQHVETGLSRLPLSMEAASGAMKFAGQMGDYAMTLAKQVSGGSMLTAGDEQQIESILAACQGLNAHLSRVGESLYDREDKHAGFYEGMDDTWPETAVDGDSGMDYPSLIYDGPFSDGRKDSAAKGLTGARVTREQARQAAARYAGVTGEYVRDAADSGGVFEAFGFIAETDDGNLSVQVTGQGGHLLWMMPEDAQFDAEFSREECLERARQWLAQMGYGEMAQCFVQEYDGMVVANYAAVQDDVLLYPDQVKLQVSRATGRVVGAECSQYLMNHTRRTKLEPEIGIEEAKYTLSGRLDVQDARLCVIPTDAGEKLCWEFSGSFSGAEYAAYVDAGNGEALEILRVLQTQDGEAAL